MTKNELNTTTKECPYCHAVIPYVAKICANCWKDLETGKSISPTPVNGKIILIDHPKHPEMKTCMHCNVVMPAKTLLCPICSKIQDSEFIPKPKPSPNRHIGLLYFVALASLFVASYFVFKPEIAKIQHITIPMVGTITIEKHTNVQAKVCVDEISRVGVITNILYVTVTNTVCLTNIVPQAAFRDFGLKRTETEVTCPQCQGKGKLLRLDSKINTYQCPVCLGNRVRVLSLTDEQALCSHCSGMGQIGRLDTFFHEKNVYVADRCPFCQGTGITTK